MNRRDFLRLLSVGLITSSQYPQFANALTWKKVSGSSSGTTTSPLTITDFNPVWSRISLNAFPAKANPSLNIYKEELYIYGGGGGGQSMYKYNPTDNSCSLVTYNNTCTRGTNIQGAISFSYKDIFYYLGGFNNSTSAYIANFDYYDPSTKTWGSFPSAPFPTAYGRGYAVYNDKLFVIHSGNTTSDTFTLLCFNFANLSWTTITIGGYTSPAHDTSYSNFFFTIGFVYDNVLYCAGNYGCSACYNNFFKIDLATLTLTMLPNTPVWMYNASNFSNNSENLPINNKFYFSGDSVHGFYDFTNYSWNQLTGSAGVNFPINKNQILNIGKYLYTVENDGDIWRMG